LFTKLLPLLDQDNYYDAIRRDSNPANPSVRFNVPVFLCPGRRSNAPGKTDYASPASATSLYGASISSTFVEAEQLGRMGNIGQQFWPVGLGLPGNCNDYGLLMTTGSASSAYNTVWSSVLGGPGKQTLDDGTIVYP